MIPEEWEDLVSIFKDGVLDSLGEIGGAGSAERRLVAVTKILMHTLDSYEKFLHNSGQPSPLRPVDIPVVQGRLCFPDGFIQIPVPHGWSPEQAWEAACRSDGIPCENLGWAVIEVRQGRFVQVVDTTEQE